MGSPAKCACVVQPGLRCISGCYIPLWSRQSRRSKDGVASCRIRLAELGMASTFLGLASRGRYQSPPYFESCSSPLAVQQGTPGALWFLRSILEICIEARLVRVLFCTETLPCCISCTTSRSTTQCQWPHSPSTFGK